MRRTVLLAAAGVLLAAGCAPATPSQGALGPQDSPAQWVPGPDPGIRTLVVHPQRTGQLAVPGSNDSVQLSIGAFFSRWELEGAKLDQLALLIQLEGSDAQALMTLGRELLLEMDGALYVGEPGTTGSSFHLRTVDGVRQLSVAVPIHVLALQELIDARTVRGVLGETSAFAFPREGRARLRSLLLEMPADGAPASEMRAAFRITDLS